MSSLEERVRSLEEWRDHLLQALMYAPKPATSDILSKFPEQLQQYLTVKDGAVMMKEFVNSEIWQEINKVALSLGYTWISDKANSRWVKA